MGQKLKFALRLLVSVLLLGILIYIAGPAQIYNELVSSRLDYNFAGFDSSISLVYNYEYIRFSKSSIFILF